MAADALVMQGARSSAAMLLVIQDTRGFVFPMGKFHLLGFDGLVQDCSNSIADALELLQSCTEPSMMI